MITKLQNIFLKHNKVLFGGLLVIIIVTFVLTIGPQSFFDGSQSRSQRELAFYGYNLGSERDRQVLSREAEISAMLRPELRLSSQQMMDYAYLRATGLGIANQLRLPEPTESELKTYLQAQTVFQDPETGNFSAESYNRILEMLRANDYFSESDMVRVIRQDYRIEKVRDALGGPLYRLDFDLFKGYQSQQTTFDVELAKTAYADFKPELDPTTEELQSFYDENPEVYEVPDRIKVTALYFEAAQYLDEVPDPSETDLVNYFARNRDSYQPTPEVPTEGEEAPEVPEINLADVRDEVILDWKLAQAKTIAGEKSEAFSLAIWENKVERNSEAFDQLVANFNVKPTPVAPYARDASPYNPRIPRNLLNSMWVYESGSRYFSDLAQNRDGAVLLVLDESLPNRLPEFSEVQAKVRQNWIEQERRRLFAEYGAELKTKISEALESKSFAEAAEGLGLTVENPEPFTGMNIPSSLSRNQAWAQGQYLQAGELTSMVLSDTDGTFLYMQEKTVPEISEDSPEFISFKEEQMANANAFAGWSRLRELSDNTLAQVLGPDEQ